MASQPLLFLPQTGIASLPPALQMWRTRAEHAFAELTEFKRSHMLLGALQMPG